MMYTEKVLKFVGERSFSLLDFTLLLIVAKLVSLADNATYAVLVGVVGFLLAGLVGAWTRVYLLKE